VRLRFEPGLDGNLQVIYHALFETVMRDIKRINPELGVQ